MQLTNHNQCGVDKEASRAYQGRVVMPIETTITLAAVGKWLIGLVLAPWLWYERKRVDKLETLIASHHFTKEEVKEQIRDKTTPLQDDMHEVKETMKVVSENIVAISVTVARIDERSKKGNERSE